MNLVEHSSREKFYTTTPSVYEDFFGVGKEEVDKAVSSDEFRMFKFKIKKCTKPRSHDWTDCPYAHPGEKARRRDPRIFPYSGIACPEFRRGKCEEGVNCEFAHGVFEFWLHPSRYRTKLCKDGINCRRKICFFAHSLEQLRFAQENKGHHSNRSSNREIVQVASPDLYDLILCMKRLQIEEYRPRVFVSHGEEAFFSKSDFDWVSELVK